MRFFKLEEIQARPDDKLFKVSPVGSIIAGVIFWGLAIGAIVLGVHGHKATGIPPFFCYGFAVLFALVGLVAIGRFRASCRPTNWILRCSGDGIVIHYRSFLNWRLPTTEAQAVGLEFSEIAWARKISERRTTPSMDSDHSSQTSHVTYLCLGLVNADTSALEAHLAAERNFRPDGYLVSLDFPVQVLPGGIVEVRWDGGVRPRLKKALEALGERVKIAEPESRSVDLVHHRNDQPGDEKAKIALLAKSGDEIGAANLARQVFGYNLTEAVNYVDKLKVAP